MPYAVDFTIGLESSPVAAALAGLRANEAACKNQYDHDFTVEPASNTRTTRNAPPTAIAAPRRSR
jgi:hypothetical protein